MRCRHVVRVTLRHATYGAVDYQRFHSVGESPDRLFRNADGNRWHCPLQLVIGFGFLAGGLAPFRFWRNQRYGVTGGKLIFHRSSHGFFFTSPKSHKAAEHHSDGGRTVCANHYDVSSVRSGRDSVCDDVRGDRRDHAVQLEHQLGDLAGRSDPVKHRTISGIPTTAGNSSFTIKVSDSSSPANPASGNFSIIIAAAGSNNYGALLRWTASSSTGITGYNVYRSSVSGSGYVPITSSPISGLTYTDTTVTSGQTYYYVTTAIDASGEESTYSDEVQAVIP